MEKLDIGIGEEVVFDKVLLIKNEERTEVGSPYLTAEKYRPKFWNMAKEKNYCLQV